MHVAAGLLVVLVPAPFSRSARLTAETEVTIQVQVFEFGERPAELREAEAPTEPVVPVAPSPIWEPERPRRGQRVPRESVVAMPEPAVSVTPEATEPESNEVPTLPPQPAESPQERRRGLGALLDPRAVAASSFRIEAEGPSQPTAPSSRAIPPDRGPSEREIERSLSHDLREQAMAKAYLVRTAPEFRRQRDGSYVYEGHAFRATIRPDGSIEFDDRPGIRTDGFSTSGTFDLNDALMRASGGDPYAAEREWVMEHTEELRARLEAEHRRATMARALSRIAAECERIWGRTSRTPAQRRREIFELWDAAEEDGDGARARAAIEQWIRERLPAGGPDGYSSEELARLNATRQSRAEFDPYR